MCQISFPSFKVQAHWKAPIEAPGEPRFMDAGWTEWKTKLHITWKLHNDVTTFKECRSAQRWVSGIWLSHVQEPHITIMLCNISKQKTLHKASHCVVTTQSSVRAALCTALYRFSVFRWDSCQEAKWMNLWIHFTGGFSFTVKCTYELLPGQTHFGSEVKTV